MPRLNIKIDIRLPFPFILAIASFGCSPVSKEFIRVPDGYTALVHARVIDGTGGLPKEDQSILIKHGRIEEIGDSSRITPTGATILDLRGYTILPGLVGMHDHLFYALPPGTQYKEMLAVFPKLYLAAGVTTLRTTGTIDIETELNFKKRVDRGRELGPHLYLSTPYVQPDESSPPNPARWSGAVEQLIPLGINSVKVYTHARSSELAAVIQAAHRHGVRVTGHLCAVGWTEAIGLGIDNLEHGLIVDTEFYSRRQPDKCPDQTSVVAELVQMDIHGALIQGLIQRLVQHHVAVTSTLPVFESFSSLRLATLDARTLTMLAPDLQSAYRSYVERTPRAPDDVWERMLKKEMEFEREFVKAGGLLMAGTDPTGWGGVIAGYGDQRELELLGEAGFAPEQAIKIATYNGALFGSRGSNRDCGEGEER
jgi:imidazolonepropionase-like amidohydrolase